MLTFYSIDNFNESKKQRYLKNIVGKGEITQNKQFLLFPQCFLLIQINESPFVHIFNIKSLFAIELEEPKIGISGKGLIGHAQTNASLHTNGIVFFSLTSQHLPSIEVMAGFECIVTEMNVTLTIAYLNEFDLGVLVLSWSGRHSTWLSP